MAARKGPTLTIYRKNTVNLTIHTSPVDTSGAMLYFTVKPDFDNDSNDTNAPIRIAEAGGSGEKVLMRLAPTDTDITAGDYVYDIKYVKGDDSQTLFVGKLIVEDVVTLRV